MKSKVFLLIFILFFTAQFSYAENIQANIVSIQDGDTITVKTKSNKKVKIRMYGIDAPELSQSYGQKSKQQLAKLLKNKNISYKTANVDSYGRTVATVYAGDINVNYEMIKSGYAWHYKHYYKSKRYAEAEKYARDNKLGLWAEDKPTPPWKYREDMRESSQNQQNINLILKIIYKILEILEKLIQMLF